MPIVPPPPPWPISPSPELSVQAMKTQPETRQTRIVDVLRIESSKIRLGPADASTVPHSRRGPKVQNANVTPGRAALSPQNPETDP
jgi:hypothetical protein